MNEKPFSDLQEGEISQNNGAKDSVANSTIRVCDFCGRVFTCGKALGGHRRHHLQALKKKEAHKNHHHQPKGNNVNNNPFSHSSKPFRCSVCEKDFQYEKQLYGHMRSHPEREWRGMNPPSTSYSEDSEMKYDDGDNNNNKNGLCSSSSSSPLGYVDLSLSIAGCSWLKKGRRGRPSIFGFNDNDAAQCLAYMSLGKYPHHPPSLQEEEEEEEEEPAKKRKTNRNSDDRNGSLLEVEDVLQMTLMSFLKIENKPKMNKKEKVIEKSMAKLKGEDQLMVETVMQEVVVKSTLAPQQKYVCNICGESFSCCRALGGHKSKHNKANHKKGKEVMEEHKPEVKGCVNEEEEERLVLSSNVNGDINMSNQGEEEGRKANHQYGSSKMMDIDLNLPYALDS